MLVKRLPPDRNTSGEEGAPWEALMHPGQKLKPGARVVFGADVSNGGHRAGESPTLHGEVLERHFFGRRVIRLWADGPEDVDALIDKLGHVPLPPYIHRLDRPDDRERYQTIYARRRGSVAAPTAGLHFNEDILRALDARGVERVAITLHVGYGTFQPVRSEEVEEHVVEPERYEITPQAAVALNQSIADGRRIVAVGTTATRALESAALAGAGQFAAGEGLASLFIFPGFEFRVVGALMTNFHLPKSSLLMLVAAFAGREHVLAAYREAVEQRYRFYSYGDAMVIV
jgi:S-adenosylmethionine:tRNA ribosyltransferase-isomerase